MNFQVIVMSFYIFMLKCPLNYRTTLLCSQHCNTRTENLLYLLPVWVKDVFELLTVSNSSLATHVVFHPKCLHIRWTKSRGVVPRGWWRLRFSPSIWVRNHLISHQPLGLLLLRILMMKGIKTMLAVMQVDKTCWEITEKFAGILILDTNAGK